MIVKSLKGKDQHTFANGLHQLPVQFILTNKRKIFIFSIKVTILGIELLLVVDTKYR